MIRLDQLLLRKNKTQVRQIIVRQCQGYVYPALKLERLNPRADHSQLPVNSIQKIPLIAL